MPGTGSPGIPDVDPLFKGRVLVYAGSATGPAPEPYQKVVASEPGTLFGYAVATGDVNHDGSDDLLVGEPYFSLPDDIGRAHLYLAHQGRYPETPTCTLTGRPGSKFGIAVALGDVNGDGFADAVVGAPSVSLGAELSDCGAAYVYMGSAAGLDSIATILPGRQAGGAFGGGVIFAADLDADGFGDLVVGSEYGSHGEEAEGLAEIYFGSRYGISPHGSILLESNMMERTSGRTGEGWAISMATDATMCSSARTDIRKRGRVKVQRSSSGLQATRDDAFLVSSSSEVGFLVRHRGRGGRRREWRRIPGFHRLRGLVGYRKRRQLRSGRALPQYA
jgi:hypothetical protein